MCKTLAFSKEVTAGEEQRLNYKTTARNILVIILLSAVSYFFYYEAQNNWVPIRSYHLTLNIKFITLSFAAISLTYLINVFCWFISLNSISGARITFPNSIAMYHTSNLTKYIPGKVWSLALQIYWLEKSGFPKSLILYVNIITLYISLAVSMVLGLSYLIIAPGTKFINFAMPLLFLLIAIEILLIGYCSHIVKMLLSILNKIFKCDIKYFKTPVKLLLWLHLMYIIAAFSYGFSAYLLCFGIGFQVPVEQMLTVMSSVIISEVAGIISVIAPAGLGVREGVMYLQLKGLSATALPFILPFSARLLSMFADIFFGAIGFVLLKRKYHISDKCDVSA